MLESLYRALFRPRTPGVSLGAGSAWALWLLVAVVLAAAVASHLGLGAAGLVACTVALWAVLLVTWFWMGAALAAIAPMLGGGGSQAATLGAVAEAAWPLILLGPDLAIAQRMPHFHDVVHAAIALWVIVGLVFGLQRAQGLSPGRAFGAAVLAGLAVGAAVFAFIGLPFVLYAYWVA